MNLENYLGTIPRNKTINIKERTDKGDIALIGRSSINLAQDRVKANNGGKYTVVETNRGVNHIEIIVKK